MIPQKPIKDYKEIVLRLMNHLYGKEDFDWDKNSLAWKSWMTYCRCHFKELKKMQWVKIYSLAKKIMWEE